MKRVLQTVTLLTIVTFLGMPETAFAGHRGRGLRHSIGRILNPFGGNGATARSHSSGRVERIRQYQPSPYSSPSHQYRYGSAGRHFGNFYRDRQGFFYYGLDSRYRFGIHR